MDYKTTHQEYKDGPFDVKVWYAPEFVPIADLFDDTCNDVDEMARKVDTGNASWFVAGVTYSYNGHEVGSASLGGNYYDEWEDEALDAGLSGYLDDMKAEAKEDALKAVKELQASLEKDFAHA